MAEPAQFLAERPALYDWLRVKKKFPNLWCPGCGLGTVLGAFTRALMRLGLKKDDVAVVAGIGCTGRIPVYLDANTLHTTHGRALTFATGIKLVRPDMHVVVFMGDGDALAIGGNHFIHSCRRNIGLTAIVVNNAIYGMTGGQGSPTTPLGKRSTTSPQGSIDPPFDTCSLAVAAGATFVARSTAYHVAHMERLMAQAMTHDGFSVLEIVSQCPTFYGRINREGSHLDMLGQQKARSVAYAPDLDVEAARAQGKDIVIGVIKHDRERKEYCANYQTAVVRSAMAGRDNGQLRST